MITFVSTIHVLTCLFLIIFVLIQSGKGAEISASFGGSSQTVFGSSGGASLFAKITGALAAIFMFTSLFLTAHGTSESKSSVFDKLPVAPVTNNVPNPNKPGAATAAQPAPVTQAIMPGAANLAPKTANTSAPVAPAKK